MFNNLYYELFYRKRFDIELISQENFLRSDNEASNGASRCHSLFVLGDYISELMINKKKIYGETILMHFYVKY